jgi:hypothetical protein
MQSEEFTLENPTSGHISTYRQYLIGLLLPAPRCVKILKSASTAKARVTEQQVTRGLFKRLDGVIAWAEEISNLRLESGADDAALEFLRVRYGGSCSVRKINQAPLNAEHLEAPLLACSPAGKVRQIRYRLGKHAAVPPTSRLTMPLPSPVCVSSPIPPAPFGICGGQAGARPCSAC